jgi:hypothetical protein
MIKVIPVILTPLFFFIIFFNVRNLTEEKDEKVTNISLEVSNIASKTNYEDHEKKQIKGIKNDHKNENVVKLARTNNPNNKQLKSSNKKEDKDNSGDGTKKEFIKEKENVNEKKQTPQGLSETKQIVRKERKFKVQFGAFSNLKNAKSQKRSLSKRISIEFPEFKRDLRIIKEKTLFKLIYFAETRQSAESICNFSKIKEINCLILKK